MTGFSCEDCLKALAHETWQNILSLLCGREMNVSELCRHFAVTQPTISYQLSLLRPANLVVSRSDGMGTFYRANPVCIVECGGEILAQFKTSTADNGIE